MTGQHEHEKAKDGGDFVVVIPARFDASRLPGKPLRPLAGEPLVLHVARRAFGEPVGTGRVVA